MQCVTYKIDLVSLGLTILKVKMGYCPKCGLVYAQKQAAATGGSVAALGNKTRGRVPLSGEKPVSAKAIALA